MKKASLTVRRIRWATQSAKINHSFTTCKGCGEILKRYHICPKCLIDYDNPKRIKELELRKKALEIFSLEKKQSSTLKEKEFPIQLEQK